MNQMYKILIIIIIILIFVSSFFKNTFIYVPQPASTDRYQKFYQKIHQLTESPDHVTNNFIQSNPDNIVLDTLFLKNLDTDICIIYFHGNAGNISMRYDMIKFLYNFGSILIFDYRSFGKSNGSLIDITEHTMETDAEAVWSYVKTNLKYDPNKISLFGESLGCSIALGLATKLSKTLEKSQYPHSLILNSPFYSLKSIISVIFSKMHLGLLGQIISMLYGNEYRSDLYIPYVNHMTKIIIAHSPRDEIIPHKEGFDLYKLISNTHPNVKFINILGTHNNLCLTDTYIYALSDIFQS